MSNHDINKAYVSPIDIFLFKFDATHEKSVSQIEEIIKYTRIFALRDYPGQDNRSKEIWEDF